MVNFNEDNAVEEMNTGYTPIDDEKVRWLYDYDRDIYWNMRARLEGGWLSQNSKKEYVIQKPKDAQPLMNKIGIAKTMYVLQGFITKIDALSWYDEIRIREMCKVIANALARLYAVNIIKFGMSPTDARVCIRMIMKLVESNLRKSIQGRSLNLIENTERRNEVIRGESDQRSGLI